MKHSDFILFMQDLRERGTVEGIPNVSPLNAQFLHFLILNKQAKSILEIGTANGYSTLFLAKAAKQVGGTVISIDTSAERHQQARDNAAHCEVADIIDLVTGEAEAFVPFMDKQFDFVFIDARKGSYLRYFEAVLPKLAPHATVVFDDVIKFKHKMADLYGYMERAHGHSHFVIPLDGDDGIMLYIHDPELDQ